MSDHDTTDETVDEISDLDRMDRLRLAIARMDLERDRMRQLRSNRTD